MRLNEPLFEKARKTLAQGSESVRVTDTSSKRKHSIPRTVPYGTFGTAGNGRSFSGGHQNEALSSALVHNYVTEVCSGLDYYYYCYQ
jgi:hypothetical protein